MEMKSLEVLTPLWLLNTPPTFKNENCYLQGSNAKPTRESSWFFTPCSSGVHMTNNISSNQSI